MTLPRIRFSKLRRLQFLDSNELEIGSLEDVILDKKTLIPSHLILGAGFFEELMEELGNKENIDEIAPLSIVEEIDGDYVLLSAAIEDLLTTDKNGKVPIKNIIKYSDLIKLDIHDRNGKYDAELIDIELEGKNSSLVFNVEGLRMLLQREGYAQRFEISVPVELVNLKRNRLQIPSTEEKLLELAKSSVEPRMKGKSQIFWK